MADWDAIVFTSPSSERSSLYLNELKRRQKAGFISSQTTLLAIHDPKSRVGSGGATINALLYVTEHLSAIAGLTVASADTLLQSHILILHLGGDYVCDPVGKTFSCIPAIESTPLQEHIACNIDYMLVTLKRLRDGAPCGVWVSSTEMLLTIPSSKNLIDWSSKKHGITMVSVFGPLDLAAQHGVLSLHDEGHELVRDIVYKAPLDTLKKMSSGVAPAQFPLVTGIVHICPSTAEKLLALHYVPPTNGCTYTGLDDGADALSLSLFLDIIRACLPAVYSDDSYHHAGGVSILQRARKVLCDHLKETPVHAAVIQGATYHYLHQSFVDYGNSLLHHSPIFTTCKAPNVRWSNTTHVASQGVSIPPSAVLVNAQLGGQTRVAEGAVIVHSSLTNEWQIGEKSIISGVHDYVNASNGHPVQLQKEHVLMQVRVDVPSIHTSVEDFGVYVLFGTSDSFSASSSLEEGTFLNEPWSEFFARTGIEERDIFPGTLAPSPSHADLTASHPSSPQRLPSMSAILSSSYSLMHAALFPVASLTHRVTYEDVLWMQRGYDWGTSPRTKEQFLRDWRSSWRLSYADILRFHHLRAELSWRRRVYFAVGDALTRATLLAPQFSSSIGENHHASDLQAKSHVRVNECLLPYFRRCAAEGHDVLSVLDRVAQETVSPGVAGRTLACIADVLGLMAQLMGGGGLRSGPGHNPEWEHAFSLLEKKNIRDGVEALAHQRARWMSSPDALIRASRHYESAGQILIRHAVMTAYAFVSPVRGSPPPLGAWVIAKAPARIDLAGGWSDTPPITYEHGGVVVNAGILIDGEHPIECRVRRIEERVLMVTSLNGSQKLVFTQLDELRNYAQPQAPGALFKAAFCCASIVDLSSTKTLQEQLDLCGGGFEVSYRSSLPHGSGLGTSSILSGVVLAALWRAAGHVASDSDLNHAVLHLEQLLTTGGGWQDQVGGLVGGVKLSSSPASLPLHVHVKKLPLSSDFVTRFNQHLVLIYTGKTRLARNLLQNVLRNWFARVPEIVQNVDDLTSNAYTSANAFEKEDIETVGRCLSTYWEQKKLMAPGCEPAFVRKMMDLFEPHVYGQALAGAGGGGYMYVITKQPHASHLLEEIVRKELSGESDILFCNVALDINGLVVNVEE